MSFQGNPYPGPTPTYAPTQPPPAPIYDQSKPEDKQLSDGDVKSPYQEGRFKPQNRVNDIGFLVFFVAVVLGFAALSGIVLNDWISHGGLGGGLGKPGGQTGTGVTLNRSAVYLLLLITAAAVLLSATYLMLARTFAKPLMHVTLVLSILLNIGICAYYWVTRFYSGAIIFTVIAIISIIAYWGFRSRIPLAALLLQVVIDVSKHHTSVYAVAFTALLVQAAFAVWYTFTVIATYAKWTPGSPSCGDAGTGCSSGKVAGLIFFETFAFFWSSQVIGNVALATLAGGPYGCWYYFGPKGSYGGEMPKNPTLSAFGRASTKSLGSIAFGSLIVTLLDLLRLLFQTLSNDAIEEGNPIGACLGCCAACFVGLIENLVEYFNRYAYIEIALYGKPYVPAARDTWRLIKDRGIDALANDSLVSMTLTWGGYVIGLLSSLFAYLYVRFTAPSYNNDGQYTAPILLLLSLSAFSAVSSFSLHISHSVDKTVLLFTALTLSSAIEAGVSTIFVGLGEDPQVLQLRAPDLFNLISTNYPRVTQGVPGA